MYKAPCARLTTSIIPNTSERPEARMKSKAPNDRPFSACWKTSSKLTRRSLPRVGHLGDLVADRVHRLPVLGLHLADVDVLDRVVGCLIEREVAARALEAHVLEGLDEFVLVGGIATDRLEGFVERAHAVVLLDREDVWEQGVLLLKVGDELLVLGVVELDGPEKRRDRAVREILHLFEDVLLGEEPGAVHLVAGGGQTERVPALDEPDRVRAGEERIHVFCRLVLDLCDERGEVGV